VSDHDASKYQRVRRDPYPLIFKNLIINDRKCQKLLSKDGIITRYLTIDRLAGIFEGITIDVNFARSRINSIGETVTISRNLDEYQFIICSEIRSMSDINPYKIELQKYRVLIIASLARLVHLLSSLDDNKALQVWNHFAQILLTRVSETRLKAVSNRKQDENMATKPISSVFDFLGVSEDDIDRVLGSIYHVNL